MKYFGMTRKFGTRETGSWRTMRPVVDVAKCTACGLCIEFCPDGVIALSKGGKGVVVDLRFCKGCGICAKECNVRVIHMIEEP